jgi:trehalose/maltose hydrolase-like predicted phosphorylase
VIASGVYHLDGPETHLLPGPFPSRFRGSFADGGLVRTLDLRTGVLAEGAATDMGPIELVRFSSLARPGMLVERIVAPAGLEPVLPLSPPDDGGTLEEGMAGPVQWMQVAATNGGITAAAVAARAGDADGVYERFAMFTGDAGHVPDVSGAVDGAVAAGDAGFDRLFNEHRARWAQRWRDADIIVEGDDRLQTAVRFALFHLMGSVRDRGEAALGARGLTGLGYRGHVFWDADTFVLPFFAATHPASARAMLEYRIRRLPAAFANARSLARRGARFPWESAHTGVDVTPTSARDRSGRLIAIRTGHLEEHIVADVAWASSFYEDWTGDDEYRRGDGLRLLVSTAQYWASRVRMEPDGLAHIYGVIGPDEYHEPVDDNIFTNVMARWNLRRAAAAVQDCGGDSVSPEELQRWLDIADALVDGYDSDTGIYEQYSGFLSLEPLLIAEVAPRRPIAADYLLGIDRVRQAQIIKQPDALMLYHLVPDEVVRGTLEPNLRFYEPRTAHGSSLSPAIYAALFVRARDYARALEALEIASRIDLEDLTGSSSAGLHLATMGGLWQSLTFGFAGLRASGGRLHLDPRLPTSWSALEVHVRFRNSGVVIRRDRTVMTITAESPIEVVIDDRPYVVGARGLVFARRFDTWGLIT